MNITTLLYPTFFLTQLYALTYHFYQPHTGSSSPTKQRLVILISITLGLLSTFSPPCTNPLTSYPSTTCLLLSESLFLWTALTTRPRRFAVIFAQVQPQYVASTGPFAYIRHPTYVSYALGWLGVSLSVVGAVLWRLAAFVCLGVLLSLYADAAELEERQFLDEGTEAEVRAEYGAYMRRTRRWLPGVN
ncbi:hypothetical protein LTR70_010127 [Exophiala xenobiotica]|uniref:Protein-S-isoprenylcysteine O-methyltransferase n=1 Tax=Lithohypha guttulata TaxID=1690604 RepID=A0ABR0JV30_9EURO|nr:hypothetical protein LTR24_010072 [Lithohypha guttulata]KAK5309629.1 hypothetical protein LTR70_010127 [Exophiala xenobiotica]